MPNSKSRAFSFRDMENIFRTRRFPFPKRSIEFIALIAVSCTFFLFMHTKNLNSRLHEMEIKMQPSELSALGLTGSNSISNDGSRASKGLHGTYQYLKSTGQLNNLDANTLNNTKNAQMDKVVFNRVPKVGSEQMIELIKKLSRINGFKHTQDDAHNKIFKYLSPEEEKEIAEKIYNLPDSNIYVRHINYINFEAYNIEEPIYINMVRDPIERVISWYYFKRSPWIFLKQRLPEHRPLPDITAMKKTFEECVLTGDSECSYIPGRGLEGVGDHRRQTLFFCGQNITECMPFNMQGPLEVAKRHVEEKYAVVGTWEDTNITLSVLEQYIPKYFRGAKTVYNLRLTSNLKNSNPFKPKISDKFATLNPRQLNNTKKAEIDLIFFNRVAKAGSESMMELMQNLGNLKNFKVTLNEPKLINPRQLSKDKQEELAQKIIDYDSSTIYVEHQNYIDFNKYNLPKPIYVNIVRDPVERLISWFFYARSPWTAAVRLQRFCDYKIKPEEWYKKDFNECVRTGDPECVYERFSTTDSAGDYRRQSLFFCGHHVDCIPFDSPSAIQIAKQRVESEFSVVGTWEETNITLTVLEHYVPKYFSGATEIFYMNYDSLTNRNKNQNKPIIYDDVRDMIRRNLTNEIDFFQFCKQRLYKQYLALIVDKRI